MYAHSPAMTLPNPIPAADDDDAASGADSIDNNHIHYEQPSHTLEDGGVVIEDVSSDAVYIQDGPASSELRGPPYDISSQLTLSFRGQVFVFDAVTPEKVQAVLLLLGGNELSSGAQGAELASQNQRGTEDFPVRCNQPHRAASLNRFRQKRKERCFDKKVRYGVRQEVALRMQRNKGQFSSSKKSDGDSCNGQESGQDDSHVETSCKHCGISSKSTPMMRRGPDGPRSLCNACGIFWANRGSLRELSKRRHNASVTPAEQGEADSKDLNSVTAIDAHNSLAPFSNAVFTSNPPKPLKSNECNA